MAEKPFLSVRVRLKGTPEVPWMGPVCMKPGATRIIQELKREISGEIQDDCGFIAGRRESLR